MSMRIESVVDEHRVAMRVIEPKYNGGFYIIDGVQVSTQTQRKAVIRTQVAQAKIAPHIKPDAYDYWDASRLAAAREDVCHVVG